MYTPGDCNILLRDRSRLRGEPQKSFFDSFSLSNAKRLKTKAFLEVNLISLTLRACTVFKNFEKMQAILQ